MGLCRHALAMYPPKHPGSGTGNVGRIYPCERGVDHEFRDEPFHEAHAQRLPGATFYDYEPGEATAVKEAEVECVIRWRVPGGH